jgi:hypothetical protein
MDKGKQGENKENGTSREQKRIVSIHDFFCHNRQPKTQNRRSRGSRGVLQTTQSIPALQNKTHTPIPISISISIPSHSISAWTQIQIPTTPSGTEPSLSMTSSFCRFFPFLPSFLEGVSKQPLLAKHGW